MHSQEAKLAAPCISTFRSRLISSSLGRLHKVLELIKEDIDARSLLLNLALNNSQYCTSCSPHNEIGACGRTCPLLGPKSSEKAGWSSEHAVGGWADWVLASVRSYENLRSDMMDRGNDVSMEKLHEWQNLAERLRLQGLNYSEVQAEHDWSLESRSSQPLALQATQRGEIAWQYPAWN
jgi:hypothetical protein